jgi:hypothetical protein
MGQQASQLSGWHHVPILYASSSSETYLVDQRLTLPFTSNVIGYSLFKTAPARADNVQSVEVSMWARSTERRDYPDAPEQLVSKSTLLPSDLNLWQGWKIFPFATPFSAATELRVQIKLSPGGHLIPNILGPRSLNGECRNGIRIYSDRPPTAMRMLHFWVARAATQTHLAMKRAVGMTALITPPLYVAATVIAIAWYGPDWVWPPAWVWRGICGAISPAAYICGPPPSAPVHVRCR